MINNGIYDCGGIRMNWKNDNDGNIKELEILEFNVGGFSYGVDIIEIKEILPYDQNPTPIPNSHPYIEGMVMPRDFIVPIIDMVKCLQLADVHKLENEMLIVTSINDLNIAFHVDQVQGIHRVLSNEIQKVDKNLSTKVQDVVIGTINGEDTLIEILDLRKIITMINPNVLK